MTRIAKILVVEDELLIALTIQDVVRDDGHIVLGPIPTLEKAIAFLRNTRPDIALINLMLGGVRADPLCDMLDAMRVPFGFATGVDGDSDGGRWKECPRIVKPFSEADLQGLIERLLSARQEEPVPPETTWTNRNPDARR